MSRIHFTPTTVRALLKEIGVTPNDVLGQNFLIEEGIAKKIVKMSEVGATDTVIEVGPGLGILSQGLIPVVGTYIGIEKDKKLFDFLTHTYTGEKVSFLHDDALLFGKSDKNKKPENYHIVSNLPYSISSHFINVFLTRVSTRPTSMTLMLQKEVGEKVCAEPGDMTKLSVLAQTYAETKILCNVSPTAFYPKPKVDSVVVQLKTKKVLPDIFPHYEKEFWQIVRIGFSSKRKKLINNLKNGMRGDGGDMTFLKKAFQNVGLHENTRAEEVDIQTWLKIVDKIVKNY